VVTATFETTSAMLTVIAQTWLLAKLLADRKCETKGVKSSELYLHVFSKFPFRGSSSVIVSFEPIACKKFHWNREKHSCHLLCDRRSVLEEFCGVSKGIGEFK
jgi:hypothetical protein